MTGSANSTVACLGVSLAEYSAAVEKHHRAERLFHRATRTFDKLLGRNVPEPRALMLSGLNLADVRSIETYHEQRRAREALMTAWRGLDAFSRIITLGKITEIVGRGPPANDP